MNKTDISPMTETLQPIAVKKPKRSRSRFRKLRKKFSGWISLRIVVISSFVIFAVGVVSAVALATDAENRVRKSAANLNRVVASLDATEATDLTLEDFERLQNSLSELQRNLDIAERQTFFLEPFAPLNTDLETTLLMLDATQETALAGNDILAGLEPTMVFLVEGEEGERLSAQFSSGERVVELLSIGQVRFISAENHLKAAQSVFDTMDLANTSASTLLEVEKIQEYHQSIVELNTILLDSPDLLTAALGLDETRTYLVLSQNNDELRPSGGYISTYGWIEVRGGRVVDYSYSPTTATSPNPPPCSICR